MDLIMAVILRDLPRIFFTFCDDGLVDGVRVNLTDFDHASLNDSEISSCSNACCRDVCRDVGCRDVDDGPCRGDGSWTDCATETTSLYHEAIGRTFSKLQLLERENRHWLDCCFRFERASRRVVDLRLSVASSLLSGVTRRAKSILYTVEALSSTIPIWCERCFRHLQSSHQRVRTNGLVLLVNAILTYEQPGKCKRMQSSRAGRCRTVWFGRNRSCNSTQFE